MERFASTLATTAACVGLMVAGHLAIVHERGPEPPVKARPVAVAATETRAWAEPPAKPELRAAETTGTVAWTAAPPAPAAEPAPVTEAQPLVQPPVVQPAALKADKAKRTEQARRKRLAQAKERRTRTAARDLPIEQGNVQEIAPRSEPAPARQADPIGDLLRGLGIGRQG